MDKKIVAVIMGLSVLLIGGVALVLGKPEGTSQVNGSTAVNGGQVVVTERPGDWVRGDREASVTIFEFSDFECPACAAYAPIVKQVIDEYKGKVKEVYRYFPLVSIHPNAMASARAAEAAGKQGKFWEMADTLFSKQQAWADSKDPTTIFAGYAKDLGLDAVKFSQDYSSPETDKRIKVDADEADKLNLQGTPSFYINGKYVELPGSYTNFKKIIDAELAAVTVSPTAVAASPTSGLK